MKVLSALADRRFRDMYIQTKCGSLPWADPVYPLVWRSLFSCHCMFVEEERSKIGFLFESLLNSTVSFHCPCHSTLTDTYLKLVNQTGTCADENWDAQSGWTSSSSALFLHREGSCFITSHIPVVIWACGNHGRRTPRLTRPFH